MTSPTIVASRRALSGQTQAPMVLVAARFRCGADDLFQSSARPLPVGLGSMIDGCDLESPGRRFPKADSPIPDPQTETSLKRAVQNAHITMACLGIVIQRAKDPQRSLPIQRPQTCLCLLGPLPDLLHRSNSRKTSALGFT